jgi:hypothetical protein
VLDLYGPGGSGRRSFTMIGTQKFERVNLYSIAAALSIECIFAVRDVRSEHGRPFQGHCRICPRKHGALKA